MTFPSIILGIILSSLIGAGFHLVLGGNLGRFLLYLLLSWFGFWAGHILGTVLEINIFSVGPLRLGTALLGCLLVLGIGYWLSLIKPEENR